MIKPNYYYKSINLIPLEKLVEKGYEDILIDLDNTLSSFRNKFIDDDGLKFINRIKQLGLKPFIISNNSYKRVLEFIKGNDVAFLYRANKPFKRKIYNFIKENNINIQKAIFIGDQLYTDIKVSNKLQIDSILVEPKDSKDLLITYINRNLDKRLRNKLKRNGLLIEL